MPRAAFTHSTPVFADVRQCEHDCLHWQRVVLFAVYAILCIAGLSSKVAGGPVAEARLPVEYKQRVERGMRDLGILSRLDREDVIRRVREAQSSFDRVSGPTSLGDKSSVDTTKLLRRRMVLDAFEHKNWSTVKEEQGSAPGRTLFFDVKNQNSKVQVSTRGAPDYWLEEMSLGEATPKWHVIGSAGDLDRLLGDATTVVHKGDSLPNEWQNLLRIKRSYLRNSDASPKRSLYEILLAQEILERRPEPGTVRIMSALPQSTGMIDSYWELKRMRLDVTKLFRWIGLNSEMSQLQSDLRPHHKIETATKDDFVNELRKDNHDYVVLIAHFDAEGLHFPDGKTMTTAEFGNIKRETAPERTLILISCDAGLVNGPVRSIGEIALKNNLALGVIAPPHPVSAAQVPGLLRSYLIEHKTIRDVFLKDGNLHHMAENLQAPREERASLPPDLPSS